MTSDIKLARQCLEFKGYSCKGCLNKACPLNYIKTRGEKNIINKKGRKISIGTRNMEFQKTFSRV